MGGHGSNAGLLAIGDANAIVLEMGEREMLPVVQHAPVIAGVNGTDPTRVMPRFLTTLRDAGFAGVINFPSHGIIDGRWRQSLEETGFGLRPRGRDDPAGGGAGPVHDGVLVHPGRGLPHGRGWGRRRRRPHGPDHRRLDRRRIDLRPLPRRMRGRSSTPSRTRSAEVRGDVLVVSHGGPIATPDDAGHVLGLTRSVGFIGASSIERIPIEEPIRDVVAAFKDQKLGSDR